MINSIGATTQNGVGHLACDTLSDLSNFKDYAKSNALKLGTDIICLETGQVFMMDSEYVLHEL